MTEIHALSGAYAVDAIDDLERAQFERHLADCADCRAEVASLRETAALLAGIDPAAPRAQVRVAVLKQITKVRPLPPVTGRQGAARRVGLRRSVRLLIAAVLVVVAGAGLAVVHPWSGSQHQTLAVQVLQAGDAVSKQVDLPSGGSVTLVNSRELGRAVLVTHDIAAPPPGRTYELWLQDGRGNMHPAGLVDTGGNRTVVLRGDSAAAQGAGITVEPAGGTRQPTSAPIALVGFGKA